VRLARKQAAFGSLVIAVVRTIRAIVAYVQRMSISKNKIVQVVLVSRVHESCRGRL
jgi:hypothetical protein